MASQTTNWGACPCCNLRPCVACAGGLPSKLFLTITAGPACLVGYSFEIDFVSAGLWKPPADIATGLSCCGHPITVIRASTGMSCNTVGGVSGVAFGVGICTPDNGCIDTSAYSSPTLNGVHPDCAAATAASGAMASNPWSTALSCLNGTTIQVALSP